MTVKIYSDISLMTGVGEEWLLGVDGLPNAKFINGSLVSFLKPEGNEEVTK